jgi:uncharacterized membrane protein YhhN
MAQSESAPRIVWSVPLNPFLILSALLAIAYGALSPGLYDAGAWPYALAIFKVSSILFLALVAAMHRARLLLWALIFGGAGDVGLALGEETFLSGAIAFLIGHLIYIRLFLRGREPGGFKQPIRYVAMLAIAATAVVMTNLLVPRDDALFVPLTIYTGVLTLMTMTSFVLPWRNWLAMAGAVLFFISDGFVAWNMFHHDPDPTLAFWRSFAGWMIYWAGQAAICYGALGLHRAPRNTAA